MKYLLFFIFPFSFTQAFTQVSNAQLKGNFAEISKLGRLQGGESLQNFANTSIKGSKYFEENWETGSVTANTGELINNNYVLLFDKQNHDLYVKEKTGTEIILLDKKQVKQFSIGNHTFLSGSLVAGEPDKFYEVLAGKENGIALYKLINTKFIKADKQDLERIKRGDFDDEYRDDITYFIKLPNQPLQKIKLNENSLLKVLPDESKRIKEFFNNRGNNEIDQKFISALITSLNS